MRYATLRLYDDSSVGPWVVSHRKLVCRGCCGEGEGGWDYGLSLRRGGPFCRGSCVGSCDVGSCCEEGVDVTNVMDCVFWLIEWMRLQMI